MGWPRGVLVASAATGFPAALGAAALTALGLAAALLATGALPSEPLPKSATETTIAVLALGIVVGAAVVSWWLVEFRPRVAVGLCWMGLASFLPDVAVETDLPVLVRAALLATPPLAIGGAVIAATGWAPPSARARATIWIAVGLSTAATAVHALAYDPFRDPGCWQVCEPVPPVITALGLRGILGLCALVTLLAACAAAIGVESARSAPLPVRMTAVLAVMLIAVVVAIPWLRWGSTGHTSLDPVLRTIAVAGVTVSLCSTVARERRMRRSLARVLEHLGDTATSSPAGWVRAVHFAVPGQRRWIDHEGQPVVDPGEPCMVLGAERDTAVRLVLTRRRDRDEIVAAITPAGRIAFENRRLDAVDRARLADVRASQRRIVAASDAERRRVERDLHDGAQQRLVSVAMHLRLALARADAAQVEPLTTADRHLRRALESLRMIAHGAFPAALTAEGLPAAVEDLAAAAPLPVELQLRLPDYRLPDHVEMAAYVSVAAALQDLAGHDGATQMSVTIAVDRGSLLLVFVGDAHGQTRGLIDIGDRIGAAGGRLDIARTSEGTVVTVMIPCES